MDNTLRYSKHQKQWRWTLLDPVTRRQESGQQYHIRDAMSDVATTVEYMIERSEYEGEEDR